MKDISGQKFNRLYVIKHHSTPPGGHAKWLCLCDCGALKVISGKSVRSGVTKSCGCLQKERSTTHGKSGSPELRTWKHMLSRCANLNDKSYPRYGGRGIIVCSRWQGSFESFYEDMGQRPGAKFSIDRIDNNGNYTPENCRWATNRQQCNNKRTNTVITHNGESLTIAQWSRKVGLSHECIRLRLKRGWSASRTLSEPSKPRGYASVR